MKEEHLGDYLYVSVNTEGNIVLTDKEVDDRDNEHVLAQIVLTPEHYAGLMDYITRAMIELLPQRSKR